jgi:hypothetical protein
VTQVSPASPILFAINTSGLINWIEEYKSAAEGQSFVDDLSWVAIGSDVNHVVLILERCTAKNIESASRRRLQFDTARSVTALFMPRRGHRKHLQPKLTAMIRVRNVSIRFNTQGTCCNGTAARDVFRAG